METMGVSARHCLQNFKGRRSAKSLIFWEKTGAGEGIRTLDPNLGKVAKMRFWLFAVDCGRLLNS